MIIVKENFLFKAFWQDDYLIKGHMGPSQISLKSSHSHQAVPCVEP